MPYKDYSLTESENDVVGNVNFAEGQNPSTVNDSCREMMVDARTYYESPEFRDWGHTVNYDTATTFTVNGANVTGVYKVNRKIKVNDVGTFYGRVTNALYSGGNTTVTVSMDSGSISASLTSVEVGIDPNNPGLPYGVTIENPTLTGTTTVTTLKNTTTTFDGGYDNAIVSSTRLGNTALSNLTSGIDNTAIGNGALAAATTIGSNTAVGSLSATSLSSGNVTAVGANSCYSATSSVETVAVGLSALYTNSTGINNTAIGASSLYNSTGSNNTAVGRNSLVTLTSSGACTAVGADALYAATGQNNTAVGQLSGYAVTTGVGNTLIGMQSGNTLTTGSNDTCLGYNAQPSSVSVSNEITLGDGSIATLRCQVTTITAISDERDKDNIQDLNQGLEFVNSLRPVSFTWNMRDGGKVDVPDTGFIAQDLQAVQKVHGEIPGLVYDSNPDRLEAGYGKLMPILVQAIKDLSKEVEQLKAQLA